MDGDNIRSIIQDRYGWLWVRTQLGLKRFDGKKFHGYKHDPGDPNSLISNNIKVLHEDRNGKIWVGTSNGLDCYDPAREEFHHYYHQGYDPESLSNERIRCILEDSHNNLWVGTSNGLNRLNRETDSFDQYFFKRPGSNNLRDSEIHAILEGDSGVLWIGTSEGLIRFDPVTEKFERFRHDPENPRSLSTNVVECLYQDRQGYIWVGLRRRGGLNRFHPNTGQVDRFQPEPDERVGVTLLFEDQARRLWVGTNLNRKMYIFDEASSQFTLQFSGPQEQGEPYKEISAFFQDREGTFWIGNNGDGLYSFAFEELEQPYKLYSPSIDPSVTTFGTAYKDSYGIFWLSTSEGLHQFDPATKVYRTLLPASRDNLENTFSNLRPGTCTLRLTGSNNDGVWTEEGVSLPITILPPWWLTLWAKMSYVFLAGGLLYSLYQYQLKRKLEVANAHRLQELDRVKTKLFTNITHEFRTPLTVIQGLAEQGVEQEGNLPPEQNLANLQLIRRNGAQLITLVNQMLDLRKLESGQLPVRMVQGDVIQYLRYLIESFHSYAESKGVHLHFLCEEEALVLDYDPEKWLYIVSNLLSNAIKFTPAGGNVYFSVDYAADTLKLTVKDTGVGIEADNLPHIFNRFYQVDDSPTRKGEGSGIGLALTRELVNLLQGEIEVSSKLEKGTVFAVRLPITRKAEVSLLEKTDLDNSVLGFTGPDANAFDNRYGSVHPLDPPPAGDTQPLALIIEDNPDVVRYLSSCLEADYKILTAHDGQTGIDTALDMIPDIIISDVMMPQRDGYEVCDILKNDERTSHIPIILLTAKADHDSRIAGLSRGADAYLAKPFHREELRVRLEQMIELRRKLQEHYGGLLPEEWTQTRSSLEADFLRRVRKAVEDNLSDPDFDITRLCRAVGLSRSQLFRKLKALTGKSTTTVVRSIRLQRGRQLLLRTQLNVSEVAYEVGFRDPNYFSKCFQDEFGELPSAVRS